MAKRFSIRFYITAVLIILLGVISLIYLYIGSEWVDFPGQHQLCAYVLRGIDPYPYIGGTHIPEQARDVGIIPSGWGAVPWGLLLGNIFYFGFMDIKNAEMAFLIVNILILSAVVFFIRKKAAKIYSNREFIYLSMLLAAASPDYFIPLFGNAGGIICCMLILVWILCDERPVLAGILLGFAMVKPQVALIICLGFMLQKRFMPVTIAAVIDIAAWLCVSIMTKTNMLMLLKEFLMSGTGGSYRYSGIMTPFISNNTAALIASMLIGIIFVLLMQYLFSNNLNEEYHSFSLIFAYIASNFWCYRFNSDNYVLLVPSLICLYIATSSKKLYEYILWFCAVFYCNYGLYVKSSAIWGRISGFKFSDTDKHLVMTIYALGLMLVSVIIYTHLRKLQKE